MRKSAESTFFVCKIGVDIDAETYISHDRDSLLIHREVLRTLDIANPFLKRDAGIVLELVYVHIQKEIETDPYHGQDGYMRFFRLSTNWPEARLKEKGLDVIMHLSVRHYGSISGMASIGGPYNISPWATLPTILHELGHNFSSPHTHNCSWPGGPLETCVSSEGGCRDGELLHQDELGTIMGYCNGRQAYHPLSAAMMANYAKDNLQEISSPPGTPVFQNESVAALKPFYIFPPVNGSETYYFEISEDPDFKRLHVNGEVPVNTIPLSDLKAGENFYLRIKAANRFGESAWSVPKQVTIPSGALLPPKIEEVFTNRGKREYLSAKDDYLVVP